MERALSRGPNTARWRLRLATQAKVKKVHCLTRLGRNSARLSEVGWGGSDRGRPRGKILNASDRTAPRSQGSLPNPFEPASPPTRPWPIRVIGQPVRSEEM